MFRNFFFSLPLAHVRWLFISPKSNGVQLIFNAKKICETAFILPISLILCLCGYIFVYFACKYLCLCLCVKDRVQSVWVSVKNSVHDLDDYGGGKHNNRKKHIKGKKTERSTHIQY